MDRLIRWHYTTTILRLRIGIEIVNFTISLALSAGTLMASAGTPYRLVPAHFYPWRRRHACLKIEYVGYASSNLGLRMLTWCWRSRPSTLRLLLLPKWLAAGACSVRDGLAGTRALTALQTQHRPTFHLRALLCEITPVRYADTLRRKSYTWDEVTSQNLWPRYNRHFVGIAWHNVRS